MRNFVLLLFVCFSNYTFGFIDCCKCCDCCKEEHPYDSVKYKKNLEGCRKKIIYKYSSVEYNENLVEEICPICIDKFADNKNNIVKTECNHYFHKECIDEWLKTSCQCPICKTAIRDANRNYNNVRHNNERYSYEIGFNERIQILGMSIKFVEFLFWILR